MRPAPDSPEPDRTGPAETHQLGDLQLAIMRVLWSRKEATVAEVHEALLDERERALTTIATMLTKMERKGVVAHRSAGRVFVYRATVTERAVRRSMVAALTERLFSGDASALVSHLIDEEAIDPAELAALRAAIAEREGARRAPARSKTRGGKANKGRP